MTDGVHGLSVRGEVERLLLGRDAAVLDVLRRLHDADAVDLLVLGEGLADVEAVGSRGPDPAVLALTVTGLLPRWTVLGVTVIGFEHPYNIARRALTAHHLSGGRYGVALAVPSAAPGAPAAADVATVVRELWNSWPIDSIVGDREIGRYADLARIRKVAGTRPGLEIAGPLGTPSSRFGEPVLAWWVGAGARPPGRWEVAELAVVDAAENLPSAMMPTLVRHRFATHQHMPDTGAGTVLTVDTVAELETAAELLTTALTPRASEPGRSTGSRQPLRRRLGLPDRSLDLGDRPLAFADLALATQQGDPR